MRHIIIGSRESALAVVQAEMVCNYINGHCKDVSAEILTMKTTGDIILDRTLDQIGGKGLFVKELDQALLDGRCDLAVHSLKDVPMDVPKDLALLGYSKREDPRDVLVLPAGRDTLDEDKPIGCSGVRRQLQLSGIFPNMRTESIRGNVQTRLAKLDRGEYGALVLAAAGLKRLGLSGRIHRYFTAEEMLPAAGQGVLAIQGRKDEDDSFLEGFYDEEVKQIVLAERAFVRELDGGCSSPVAAHGKIQRGGLELEGLFYQEETGAYYREMQWGEIGQAEEIGRNLAQKMRGRKR